MRQYAEASGDTKLIEQAEIFGAIADNITSAAEGFKSGSWIGAIIGGGSNLLSGFINSVTAAKAQAVKLKQALDDIATAAKNANYEMLMSGESRETYFGTDSYGKFLDAVEAEKEA